MLRKSSGFTLIELLVVMTIIGILASILAPDYLEYNRKTNLSNTSKLVQSTLFETFSLSRSRSAHYVAVGIKDTNFIEIHKCDNLACTSHSIVADSSNSSGEKRLNFLGKNVVLDSDFKIQFLAPHGDILFPDEVSTLEELDIKIGETTDYKTLKIYKNSGLVEL